MGEGAKARSDFSRQLYAPMAKRTSNITEAAGTRCRRTRVGDPSFAAAVWSFGDGEGSGCAANSTPAGEDGAVEGEITCSIKRYPRLGSVSTKRGASAESLRAARILLIAVPKL